LIGEVIGLFLGNPFDENNCGRFLKQGFMMSLQGLITTKLDRKKLDHETMFIQHEDSAAESVSRGIKIRTIPRLMTPSIRRM